MKHHSTLFSTLSLSVVCVLASCAASGGYSPKTPTLFRGDQFNQDEIDKFALCDMREFSSDIAMLPEFGIAYTRATDEFMKFFNKNIQEVGDTISDRHKVLLEFYVGFQDLDPEIGVMFYPRLRTNIKSTEGSKYPEGGGNNINRGWVYDIAYFVVIDRYDFSVLRSSIFSSEVGIYGLKEREIDRSCLREQPR